MGLACCAINDGHRRLALTIAHFGSEVFRATAPADVMLVSGVSRTNKPTILRNIYDEMAMTQVELLSMGACASSGGVFNNYAVVQGCDHVVPVDHAGLPASPRRCVGAAGAA